ncbi:MAG: efflux RND transporter periplasmic adaptor subunit [Xenococcaceae cyanobacterium MO_188.B29]|nr:efflux RND transporter periplasmic adaptor subunit [Xenococcaceae cyanobacterium MO_188.B29]
MEFPLIGKVTRPLPWILGLIGSSFLIFGIATHLSIKSSKFQDRLEELTVLAEQQDLTVKIQASGTVKPIKSVNISPKTPGRLVKLLVEQGDKVEKGQTLAVMENVEVQMQQLQAQANLRGEIANLQIRQTEINSQIDQAEARLRQAIAQLEQAKARIPRDIQQTKAQITAAESRLKLAKQRTERNQYLLEEGAITQDRNDEVLNEYQNAQANLSELKQKLEQLENTSNPEINRLESAVAEARLALAQNRDSAKDQIAALEAAVEASRAALKQVEVQYEDTIITAPFTGIVNQRYAIEGAFVTPTTSASASASATATSILALAQGLEIVAEVPEVDVGQLQPGQQVEIIADAYPDRVFLGEVKRIAPEAVVQDNVTSFEVRVDLITGQDQLRSKMNVDVTFLGQELKNTLVVPTVAIVTQAGETGVMIVNQDNKPEFKPVTIGLILKDKAQILDGLTSEDKVFIDLPEYPRNRP